jgi:hypothetical protein
MPDVREVAEKVYRFEIPIAGMFYTPVVYLIAGSKGVLIEPGPAAAAPSIQQAMAQTGMKDLSHVIPTTFTWTTAAGRGHWRSSSPMPRWWFILGEQSTWSRPCA